MDDFTEYLNDDDAAALEKISAGLKGLRLEKKVSEAAAWRHMLARQRFFKKLFALGIVALMVLGAAFFWFSTKKTEPSNQSPALESPSQLPENQSITPIPETISPQKKRVVAERPKTDFEKNDEPLVRGLSPDLDSATVVLFEKLVSETMRQSGRFSENSIWKKAVAALQKNEFAEAKKQIFEWQNQTNAAAAEGESKWLLGLVFLEEGRTDEAESVFSKIAEKKSDFRQKLAKKALEALQAERK